MPDLHAGVGVFASRPLPRPIYTTAASPTQDRSHRDSRIGVLVHRVIGEVVHAARVVPLTDAVALVGEAVERLVPTSRGATRTRVLVRSHACSYLTHYLPGPDCTFLGAEVRVEKGRVDLAWSHPTLGVWFDEIKTWRHARMSWDGSTHDQIARYLDSGRAHFGDQFAGVRLIVTGHSQDSVLIDPHGEVVSVWRSALAPHALVAEGAA